MVIAKKIIIVLSGKGGVGKSTVACQIALCYKEQNLRVAFLDIDLCGPSVPRMLNLSNASVVQSSSGHWVPIFYEPHPHLSHPAQSSTPSPPSAVEQKTPESPLHNSHNGSASVIASEAVATADQCQDPSQSHRSRMEGHLEVMSIGFLLNKQDDAVIWRGPKKNAMINQFLSDVQWSDNLDLLVIDTPPGTSDEHMSIVEHLKSRMSEDTFASTVGAVVVTTPQAVSVHDVQREINFCQKCQLHVLGIIENMSGLVCSHCSHCTYIFSQGGGKSLASKKNLPFLGSIPVDPNLAAAVDKGDNFMRSFNSSVAVGFIEQIILKLNSGFLLNENNSSSNHNESSSLPP